MARKKEWKQGKKFADDEKKEMEADAADKEVKALPKEVKALPKEVKALPKENVAEGKDDFEPVGVPGSRNVIELNHIIKRFFIGLPNELEILHGIDLTVREGEFLSIVGESGSGKSTLMNIIGALDRPTEGDYLLDGVDICRAKDKKLSEIRNQKIGFVFQTYNLLARSTALSNVELPMLYAGIRKTERTERAKELLQLVGMGERMSHKSDELSGGQKQRVAIARAMANNPSIILADEPTGSLDSKTGRLIMDIFHRLHEEEGKTIVFITHSPELAKETQRIVTLSDGMVVDIKSS